MFLIREKLKTKKYQFMYLKEKILLRQNVLFYQDNHEGINEFYFNQEQKRINYLFSWLNRINKKYNYA